MFIIFRSDATGNCLYSSVSLALTGTNRLVKCLRILTSIELFLNANFYARHPYFTSLIEKQSEYFANSAKNILPLSVSMKSLDINLIDDALVKQEAILNCHNGTWSSFLCILGLSSVLCCSICTYYPDCGQQRSKLLFNADINPRVPKVGSLEPIHVLFCYEGSVKPGEVFKPNHFVPLLYNSTSQKRKSVEVTITVKKTEGNSSWYVI